MAFSLDPHVCGTITPPKEGNGPPAHVVAATRDGCSLRFGLDGVVERRTRAGRRCARSAAGVEVVGIAHRELFKHIGVLIVGFDWMWRRGPVGR